MRSAALRRRAAAVLVALALLLSGAEAVRAGGDEPASAPILTLAAQGPVRLVAREDPGASPPAAALWLEDAAGRPVLRLPDPPGAGGWSFWRLADAAAADLDGDGAEDLVVVAEFLTGIGPSGAEPFPWAAIYLQRDGGFVADAAGSAAVNEGALAGTWTGAAPLARRLQERGE